ncbi:MAG: GNAT family N-acetyltransferase [Spirulinaceae cyanobacterium]
MSEQLLPGYELKIGTGTERALLIKFMHQTYQELFPEQKDFSHLNETVEKYFSAQTPLWFVQPITTEIITPIACLWLGNTIDQINGDRHGHIFLVYVSPPYRQQGIASNLLEYAQEWSASRGDHQISLQVFPNNQVAIKLYQRLGYQTNSLQMVKAF